MRPYEQAVHLAGRAWPAPDCRWEQARPLREPPALSLPLSWAPDSWVVLILGGISGFFSSCGASVGFLTKYDGELREPFGWRQGSQISIRVVRGSTALVSSHDR